MEMIMSMTLDAQTAGDGGVAEFWSGGPVAVVKRWWIAYTQWRLHQLAAAQLNAMSDRELKDIGLSRSQIDAALRGELMREQMLARHY
jgi:uncharacterized protein YjiS (DUF1127 family)